MLGTMCMAEKHSPFCAPRPLPVPLLKHVVPSIMALACRFTQVADKVRSRLAQPQPPPRLLEGRQISIHYVTGAAESAAGRKASDYKEGLQKLVVALGGRVSLKGSMLLAKAG